MRSESYLRQLKENLQPQGKVQSRVKHDLLKSIGTPSALEQAKEALSPSQESKTSVWERIAESITAPVSEALLQKVQNILTPSLDIRRSFSQHVFSKLTAAPATPLPYSRARWIASFAVVLILIQASPALFLAPKSVADSKALLIPTEGNVSVFVGDMWQPVTEEMVVESGMRVRTYDGQASILYHDDAVVRLDANTIFAIHDASGDIRDESIAQLSLVEGHVWAQGLTPSPVEGITIAVQNGNVLIQEGSVSIQDLEDGVSIKVWDRAARVLHNSEFTPLAVGEQVVLRQTSPLLVKKITAAKFNEDWPRQNLSKDAVHRRYIAHLQHERRIAAAGILPTSTLYPAKRIAEKVDVLLTLTEESRTEKRLQYAHTRLNEAAALLEDGEGDQEAETALEDFREEVLEIAAGTGSDSITQELVQQSLADAVAEVATLLPEDESYSLKKVVLETTADLPEEVLSQQVEQTLFVDSMTSLNSALDAQDAVAVQVLWEDIQPYLGLLETDETLDVQARKEMKILLMRFANTTEQQAELADALPVEIRDDIFAYLPPKRPTVIIMTDEEVQAVVQGMLERIYTFTMPRSRLNQVRVEMLALNGHNEQGRLLRALYYALPEQSILREKARKEIVRLRWQKAGEQIAKEQQQQEVVTQTGGTTL